MSMSHPGGRPRTVRWSDIDYARELHALGRSWAMIPDTLGYRPGVLRAAASRMDRGLAQNSKVQSDESPPSNVTSGAP